MAVPNPEARIPFHRPSIGDRESAAAVEVLRSGWLTTGSTAHALEAAFADRIGAKDAIAVTSATAALHLALEARGSARVNPPRRVRRDHWRPIALHDTHRMPRIATMIGSTLALAVGATLLAAFRVSGSPAGAGVLVFLGAWFVAIGCALHLGAILDKAALAIGWRISLKLAAWALIVCATAWAMARAPGPELLTGLLTVPGLVAIAGTVLARRDRWSALGFAFVAVALTAMLVPAALERLMMA